MQTIEGDGRAGRHRFVLVVSKYHDFVTDGLLAGALDVLAAAGAAPDGIDIVRVPGAFEIPQAAQCAAETGRYDAVVCLGCLIRGETPQVDHIASAVAIGLANAASVTGVPMAFGVLTTNAVEEAVARSGEGPANKGREAAAAALQMAAIVAQLTGSDVADAPGR